MNSKQRAVQITAVVLFSLSELFPPWLYEDSATSGESSAGYHFVLSSDPEVKPYAEMKRIFSIPDADPEHGFTVHKDLTRLHGQRFSLLFLMLGLLLLLDDRQSRPKAALGSISLLTGFAFVILYILYVAPYWS